MVLANPMYYTYLSMIEYTKDVAIPRKASLLHQIERKLLYQGPSIQIQNYAENGAFCKEDLLAFVLETPRTRTMHTHTMKCNHSVKLKL